MANFSKAEHHMIGRHRAEGNVNGRCCMDTGGKGGKGQLQVAWKQIFGKTMSKPTAAAENTLAVFKFCGVLTRHSRAMLDSGGDVEL